MTSTPMQGLQQSLRKLSDLKSNNVITDQEYETRRKQLVDNYIGIPSTDLADLAGGRGAGRGASMGRGMAVPIGGWKGYGGLPGRGVPSMKGNGKGMAAFGFYGMPAARMGLYGPGMAYPGYIPRMPMALQQFSRPGAKQLGMQNNNTCTVKVQPLPSGLTKETLVSTFAIFGDVASAVVKRGSPTYGYVNFSSPQAAAAALAQGQVNVAGTMAQVSLGKKRKTSTAEAGPSNGIGLFNLPFSTTHDELHYMLKDYDGFQTIKMVQRKDNGQFKGYAFAYFDTVEHANKAKQMLAGLTVGDQHVDVKFASQSAEEAAAIKP